MTKKSKILYAIFLLILLFVPPLIAYNYYELPGIKGYKPPEGFPWNFEPKTGEQMAWIDRYTYFPPGADNTRFNISIDVNQRGHVTIKYALFMREHLYKDFLDIMNPLAAGGKGLKPGGVAKRTRNIWIYPAVVRGEGFMMWDYFDTPYLRKDADLWMYSRSFRRVRRMAPGERADSIGGSLFTYDDMAGREVFEHDYKIIGEDRITDFHWEVKYARLFEPDWTSPEAIDTVVIEAKAKIPDYYFSKRILWFDKKLLRFVREEQYDREGYLWKIYEVQSPAVMNPKAGRRLATEEHFRNMWDPNIDFRSFSYLEYPEKNMGRYDDSWFQPDDMKREIFWRKNPTLYPPPPPELKISDLPAKPSLYLGKFPEYRKIRPDTLKRLGITK